MTLDEYTSFICSKIGQNDDLSRQACDSYVRARYRMIWDSLLWRDARCLANVTATGATLALPAAVERVVSIRLAAAGGDSAPGHTGYLEPVDGASLLASVPGVIGQTGVPHYYEEFADVDDPAHLRKLRLFPAPSSALPSPLLIAGKRPFPGLADGTSTPVLRNIDNALLAFATGDMLERQRQYGKAQAKYHEAAAHLAAMVDLEVRQGGQIIQLIPA